ncbi:MAG: hypothetical protein QNK37_06570 [Acidobacteriota bacterium]|nr:hypothetical protein [Acidobacteriota bacterium]
MPRRLDPPGEKSYHHVMTKTAQEIFWLEEPEIKEIFVKLLEIYGEIYCVKPIGYCLMSNHSHICVEVNKPPFDEADIRRRYELAQKHLVRPRPYRPYMAKHLYQRYTSLSCFMWEINRRTAVEHNRIKGTKGHLWGARFKNIVVEDGQSLLQVLAYIEMNPVRAAMVEDPADFPYSSVGRLKRELDEGKTPKGPAIAILSQLKEEVRAKTYVDWIRYVAVALREPDLQRIKLPFLLTSEGWSLDMGAVYKALETRAPANWSNPIYGSQEFRKKTLTEAGWLIPLKPRRKPNQAEAA